jgi:hypothetical protein
VDEHQLSLWSLPGYSAWAHDDEPFPWGWAVLWLLWGFAVSMLIIFSDGAYAIAGCFAGWSLLMAAIGWRILMVATSIIHDWAESRFSDPNVDMDALREVMEFVDTARECDDLDAENLPIPNSPAQRQWMRDELFATVLSLPWFMGFVHGVGFGGLLSPLIALIPSLETSVTAAAVTGVVGGAVLVACVTALFLAVIPSPKDDLSLPFSRWQRLLLLISPLLVVPALIDAAVHWLRWYARGRSVQSSTG